MPTERKNPLIRTFSIILAMLIVFGLGSSSAQVSRDPGDLAAKRQRLLTYLVRQQLVVNHFSHKDFDDSLSSAAFDLYLKQLDSQKRFLVAEDVRFLSGFANRLDDEMVSGHIAFPRVCREVLKRRIVQVKQMVGRIMAGGFDFSQAEELETDPEKLAFCRTPDELYQRWRRTLKYQVLWRYLGMQGEEAQEGNGPKGKKPGAVDRELMKEAEGKVLRSTEHLLDRLQGIEEEDYLDRYYDAICRAYDPHTNYLPPEEIEDFEISMKGSLEGIGATLREEDGFIKVVSIIPGSPAYRQGQLQAEDLILKVAEGEGEPIDVTDSRLRDAVRLIRGKKGTEVRLTIRKPQGTEMVVPIIRGVVQIEETFVRSTVLDSVPGIDGRFGYIRIPTFYRDFSPRKNQETARNSTDDVRRALQEMARRNTDGIIVDLRNNGGGSLVDAVQIAGLFIPEGPIVQIKNSLGELDVLKDEDPEVWYEGPVVVLVNRFSASASEILAGALQDYRRAVVLGGDRTHGKGTVQAVINLNQAVPSLGLDLIQPLGAMKITTQKFYRISGLSTQVQGVEPDIPLPDRLAYLKSGERYADYALSWDSVSPASFIPWPKGTGKLDLLREKSRKRLEADSRYRLILDHARRNQQRSENSRFPLRLEILQAEIDEMETLKEDFDLFGAPSNGSSSDSEWRAGLSRDFDVGEALHVLNDVLQNDRQVDSTAVARRTCSGPP
jgi:carboxyl-terminal processing protease